MGWRGGSLLRRLGWSLLLAGFAVLAVGLPLRAWGARDDAFERLVGWSNILALSAGLVGLLLTLVDRRRQTGEISDERLDRAADALCDQVLGLESQALGRLLSTGRVSSVAANVGFAERLVRFAEPGSDRSGRLDEVGSFYRQHAAGGRLVILGVPGSGKTVLALELLVRQAEARQAETDATVRARLPVPVRLSLPTWNTNVPFADWLADRVTNDYGMRPEEATALVERRRLLPVLDGLDEMDPAEEQPVRAAAAIAKLNEHVAGQRGAPLVVTSRQDEYGRLGESLRPASEIVIRPLDAEQIRDYVDRELGAVSDEASRASWQPLMDRLDDGPYERLLEVLTTPWRLTLAVSYSRAGGDPTALLPTAAESSGAPDGTSAYRARVADLLLRNFVPARTRLYGDGRYQPGEVTRWLCIVAQVLGRRAALGLSGTDIVLHQWWPIAGERRIRRLNAMINVGFNLAGLLVIGLVINGFSMHRLVDNVSFYLDSFPRLQPGYFIGGVCVVVSLVGFSLAGWSAGNSEGQNLAQVNLYQVRTYKGRRQLLRSVVESVPVGLGVGLALGLLGGLVGGTSLLVGGLVFGFSFGVVFAFVSGLTSTEAAGLNPGDPLRNDVTVWLGSGLLGGVMGAAAGAFGLFRGTGYLGGFLGTLALALAVELGTGTAGNAWIRYLTATYLTSRPNALALPFPFGRFLDWCYQAGILRQAGSAYQFRHLELRDWLRTATDAPPSALPTRDAADMV